MMGRPLMRLKTRRLEPQLTKEAFMRSANLEVYFTELGFVSSSFFNKCHIEGPVVNLCFSLGSTLGSNC